jgi:hypothetical protein
MAKQKSKVSEGVQNLIKEAHNTDPNLIKNLFPALFNQEAPKKQAGKIDVKKAIAKLNSAKKTYEDAYAKVQEALELLENEGKSANTTEATGGDEAEGLAGENEEYQANVAKYPFAPFKRKPNGIPRKGAGKGVNNANDKQLQALYPELYTSGGGAGSSAGAAEDSQGSLFSNPDGDTSDEAGANDELNADTPTAAKKAGRPAKAK